MDERRTTEKRVDKTRNLVKKAVNEERDVGTSATSNEETSKRTSEISRATMNQATRKERAKGERSGKIRASKEAWQDGSTGINMDKATQSCALLATHFLLEIL
uniref:Uncharacterized protein n=1 Tax=Glossina pallidipes TaxID=7398 RepID=A0A1A9ZRT6_GLOPL